MSLNGSTNFVPIITLHPMSKYFQIGLVLVYINLISLTTLQAMVLAGVHMTEADGVWTMAGWLLFCCAAAWMVPYFQFLRHAKAPGPAPEEEEKLERAFHEVRERAQCCLPFRLLIGENVHSGAFAIGRRAILISKSVLESAEPEELKGILAHELGRLLSGDPYIFNAFMVASLGPQLASQFCLVAKRCLYIAIGMIRQLGLMNRIILLSVLGWLLHRVHLAWPILVLTLFLLFFYFSNKLFRFLWLICSQFTEYKQDTFAWRLGYGAGLRRALGRINGKRIDPKIVDRIRRLEELDGL
jgi:Zn-dependent protease with chaperone function